MKRRSGVSHIYEASRLSKNLHLVVNAAGETVRRICQREIAVDEGILRGVIAGRIGKASVGCGQGVAKQHKLLTRFRRCGWRVQTMMQMNLQLAPAGVAKVGKLLHQAAVILLRRIKIRVRKCPALGVAQAIKTARISRAPVFHAPLLNLHRRITSKIPSQTARFKVVGNADDHMHAALRGAPGALLPEIRRQALGGVFQPAFEPVAPRRGDVRCLLHARFNAVIR